MQWLGPEFYTGDAEVIRGAALFDAKKPREYHATAPRTAGDQCEIHRIALIFIVEVRSGYSAVW
jgi:hypothetical protein